MAVTLYAPCTEALPSQTAAGDCLEEDSDIVGFLLVKKGFNIATVITDGTTYTTAKTAEDILVVKDLEAYWPGVTQNTIPGFRGRIEQHGNINYELPFKHEGVDAKDDPQRLTLLFVPSLHFTSTARHGDLLVI